MGSEDDASPPKLPNISSLPLRLLFPQTRLFCTEGTSNSSTNSALRVLPLEPGFRYSCDTCTLCLTPLDSKPPPQPSLSVRYSQLTCSRGGQQPLSILLHSNQAYLSALSTHAALIQKPNNHVNLWTQDNTHFLGSSQDSLMGDANPKHAHMRAHTHVPEPVKCSIS